MSDDKPGAPKAGPSHPLDLPTTKEDQSVLAPLSFSLSERGEPENPVLELGLVSLFLTELEEGAPSLQELVLALERGEDPAATGEEAMRLAHSLKGAARIVGLLGVVGALHAAEDTLARASRGSSLTADEVRWLLELADLLEQASALKPQALAPWIIGQRETLRSIESALRRPQSLAPPAAAPALGERRNELKDPLRDREAKVPPRIVDVTQLASSLDANAALTPASVTPRSKELGSGELRAKDPGSGEARSPRQEAASSDHRAQRVSADSLARLLGLAGESVVEARRLASTQRSFLAFERLQRRLEGRLSELVRHIAAGNDPNLATLAAGVVDDFRHVEQVSAEMRGAASEGLQKLLDVGERLYIESLRVRQRPFVQIVPSLRRQVRDGALSLKKSVTLEVVGSGTLVDADVLTALEPILLHLLTNALDHGVETESERLRVNKPSQGVIRLEVRHVRGQLQLVVTDDGKGVDPEQVRAAVVERGLISAELAGALQLSELFEFLFVPGFSTAKKLSVLSGRGVGLDAVRTEIVRLGGRIALTSEFGKGSRWELFLPVTRVVVRALLFRVGGEAFALPLARTGRVVRVSSSDLRNAEGRDYVEIDGENVGIVRADELLDLGLAAEVGDLLTLILLGDEGARYGLLVDPELAEDDLLVRPLDPRLSRVADVAATALLADGSPTLLLDLDDLTRSIEKLTRRQRPGRALVRASGVSASAKRVLVVDDSITVREVERQMLAARGYQVDVAIDGMDGWNMLKAKRYDLLVTDIDMPRMDGLELVRRVRRDPSLNRLPVIIVSYKDRDEDRVRGMEAGANNYLAKSSFHDDQLVNATQALIGPAT